MIRLVHLQGSLNGLDDAEEHRQKQHRHGYPEGIPLRPFPSIIPPLRDSSWFSFVKNLLEDCQSVSPEMELVNLSVIGSKPRTLDSSAVESLD